MKATENPKHTGSAPDAAIPGPAGAADGAAVLLADWQRAMFIHYAIPPEALQPWVPFELDSFEDQACVSLVAFTMRRMRPARGGRLAAWLFAPVAEQRFLNLRTYVRHELQSGIYFIAEWISLGICVPLGPWLYGLPYRFGRLSFTHEPGQGRIHGTVQARDGSPVFAYRATTSGKPCSFQPCRPGSVDEFLLERYRAFTRHGSGRRSFRVWHHPWPQVRVNVEFEDVGFLAREFPWWKAGRLMQANYSPGVREVGMGRPMKLEHGPGAG